MFDFIKGTIEEVGLDYLVISSNNIGYYVNLSTMSVRDYDLFEENIIYTKLIVKEDDISLVGFSTKEERNMYNLLTTVSKIGMRMALAMLSTYKVQDIAYFIKNKDIKSISKVSGYGQKTSERLVLELKDKVDNFYVPSVITKSSEEERDVLDSFTVKEDEAIEALISLGFTRREAENSVSKSMKLNQDENDVSNIIKLALTYLKR